MILNVNEIEDRVARFVRDDLMRGDASTELGVDDDLLSSGRIDSMGIMRLVGFIESEYDMGVPPEDVTIDHFYSVHSIASYIDRRIAG